MFDDFGFCLSVVLKGVVYENLVILIFGDLISVKMFLYVGFEYIVWCVIVVVIKK